jgi:hypothetical protein
MIEMQHNRHSDVLLFELREKFLREAGGADRIIAVVRGEKEPTA